MKAWILAILFSIFLIGCGGGSGEKDLTSLGDSAKYIDPNSITDKHIEIAGQVDQIIDANQNLSLNDFYEKIKQIDGIDATKIGDDVKIRFGELSIVYVYPFPDLYYNANQSIKLQKYKKTRKTYSTNKSGSCINEEKNALFLIVESSDNFDDLNTIDIFEKANYCVDIKTNNHVTFDVLSTADQYNFVYILTHSSSESYLAIEQISKVDYDKLKKLSEGVKKDEIKFLETQGGMKTGGKFYKTAKPKYFKTMDFSKKKTLFFFFSCETLKDKTSKDGLSPITQIITDNGGYGAIGFSATSLSTWSATINKIFFSYLLSENLDVVFAIKNTKEDLKKVKITEDLRVWLDLHIPIVRIVNVDIKSLHLQTNNNEPLYFNKLKNEIINNNTISKVLKTGQLVSYSTFDDGDYQVGLDRSYTRDNANQIVIDNTTKLIWQDDKDVITNFKNWEDAKTYCSNLILADGGWRLPSVKELQTLVNYGKYSPTINDKFQNSNIDTYWSSTTSVKYVENVWTVASYDGRTSNYHKSHNYRVRCVRVGQ